MGHRNLQGEKGTGIVGQQKRGQIGIIMSQHILLLSSTFVIGSAIYNTVAGERTTVQLPIAALMIVSGAVSVAYVGLANAASRYRSKALQVSTNSHSPALERAAKVSLRLAVTLWLFCCATALTFIIARHPTCRASTPKEGHSIETGLNCIMQRSGIGASLLALLVSGLLFPFMHKVHEPFRCHLLGVVRESPLLPTMLPHKNSFQRPMYSEMSFKCRSSTSLSSHTLVASDNESMVALLPPTSEKLIGLGIYTPAKSSATTFLAPRPSLSSIRTHTHMCSMPPLSPLPPLPAYLPARYRQNSAMNKAVHPHLRPERPDAPRRQRTVRVVPPSPALSALSAANLEAYNKSAESLSSAYSRSISGEKYSSRSLTTLTTGSRSRSTGSTATIKKSCLGAMRLASDPDIVMMGKKSGGSSDGSDSDVDDAATLQARLPPVKAVKAVSDFGDVQVGVGATSEIKNVQTSKPATQETWKGPMPSRPRLVVRRTKPDRSLRRHVQSKRAIDHGVGYAINR